jgi:hypothetical protein
MELADTMRLNGRWNGTSSEEKNVNIILTSESADVLSSSAQYSKNKSFPFSIIKNDRDTMQGTGFSKRFSSKGGDHVTADGVMLSSIIVLKMQMMAKHTVGNCCSNFHKLMADYVINGCGVVDGGTFECLQENPDLKFRLCCRWSNGGECAQKKKQGTYNSNKWNAIN